MSSESQPVHDIDALLITLQDTLGVVVPDEQRGDLAERMQPVLASHQFDSYGSLARNMAEDDSGKVRSEVLTAISQRDIDWRLDAEIRQILVDYIFGELPDDARVWVVGCEQGQLAYAIAMEIADYQHSSGDKKISIIASDVSQANIDFAGAAIYSTHQLSGMTDEWRKLYLSDVTEDGNGQIKDRIRQMVEFRRCDLHEHFQDLGDMDLIICLESLAYFSSTIKADILKRMSGQLKPGGILLAGQGQGLMLSGSGLEQVEHPSGVFYRRKS